MAERREVLDYKKFESGQVLSFGKIVTCPVCKMPAIERGVRVKGKKVSFNHLVIKISKGSKTRESVEERCVLPGDDPILSVKSKEKKNGKKNTFSSKNN